MSLRWISFIAYVWVGLAFLFGLTQLDINSGIGQDTNLQALMSMEVMKDRQILGFTFTLPNESFFFGMIEALIFNYSFFEGDWGFFRTFLLFPIAFATTIVVLFGVMAPVLISAAALVRNFFRT